mmetsp:Transcript_20464/g.36745  ORF Transcript_20464/g.36745 Transcript_20464/m.36745 type:complete len:231 (+) Transcript_20464:31-723(+)
MAELSEEQEVEQEKAQVPLAKRREFHICGLETPSEVAVEIESSSSKTSWQANFDFAEFMDSANVRSRLCEVMMAMTSSTTEDEQGCCRSTPAACSVIGSCNSSGSVCHYHESELESLWWEIDENGAGHVNFREFLAAFRRALPSLQAELCQASHVAFSKEEQQSHAKLRLPGLRATEKTDVLLKERSRAKAVFEEFLGSSAAGGSQLDMARFLSFFQRQGLILQPHLGGA